MKSSSAISSGSKTASEQRKSDPILRRTGMDKSISDTVREYVYQHYILPARKQHLARVAVRAGDVAKAMSLRKRMPLVCGAIGTVKFQAKYGVKLLERSGPGNGSNATFTFHV
jgi:hypothetical protein